MIQLTTYLLKLALLIALLSAVYAGYGMVLRQLASTTASTIKRGITIEP